MAYTIEQLFTRACSLVDSLKNDGTVDSSTTSDYRARTLTLVDIAQKELLRIADYFKIYELSFKPVQNMLGYTSGFDMEEYKANEDLTFEAVNDSLGGVKSYYFESDGSNGIAYIEDYTNTWNILATIPLSNTTLGFQAYKGLVIPSVGATRSRIRFTGSYYYKVINMALFNIQFETVAKIPVYQPWVKVAMPTDVKSILKVINEYPERQYGNESAYKIEWDGNAQSLYVNYYYEGKLRVQYKPIPSVPTAFTDTLVIDDVTAQAICYFLAMNFVATEQNEYLTGLFRSQYEQLKGEFSVKQPQGEVNIVDYYGLI